MSAFFERLRAALAPEYELQHELGSGGMGTVYLARDVALDCPVAIKVLRPELWTDTARQQFVREAQTLRMLRNPHIVPVHKVDERDGLHFYVMDCLEGDTLQGHLAKHGALPVAGARKLGRDLLEALDVAHGKGVIHRDVKPANFFIEGQRGVLTDFGISRRLTDAERSDPRIMQGTAAYMAPEQFAGVEADACTDIYAAGMVIYEAFTGRRWEKGAPEDGNWSGVPNNVARVLRRAVALDRKQRWPDATTFRRELWRTRRSAYEWRARSLLAAGLVVGVAVSAKWGEPVLDVFRRGPRLQIEGLAFSGPGTGPLLGDSISCALAAALRKYPDIAARGTCDVPWHWWQRQTVFTGEVQATPDSIQVTVGPRRASWRVTAGTTPTSWRHGVGDLAAVLFDSLTGRSHFLEPSLPRAVMPKTPAARKAFLEGERLLAQAKWGEAFAAYGKAAATDRTCWMCLWRHAEVGRWLGLLQDTADVAPYRRAVTLFPVQYRGLIAAEAQPLGRRLQEFEAVVRRSPEFFFGQFRFADELFHRGPLVGHERRESVTPFNAVLRERRGDFGPAWEHLAMASIADGDSLAAANAMAQLRATGASQDAATIQIRALVEVAFACRFLGAAPCRSVIEAQLRGAEAAGATSIDAGARWLPYFDAQAGAIELGRILERRPQLARSALLAQAFGALGLGRVDSARAALRRAGDRFGESDLALFSEELAAALVAFDPDSGGLAGWSAVQAALVERASLATAPPDERRRAAWMLTITAYQLGSPSEVDRARGVLGGQSLPRALERLVAAVDAASRDDVSQALRLSQPLTEIEAAGSDPDPFFRTVLHLLRSEWYQRLNSREGARRELVWYQNSDVYRYPVDRPQLAEVDWAFGPLARWRLAQLLDRGDAMCRANRDVQRLWAGGDPHHRARADSAARRLVELDCRAGT